MRHRYTANAWGYYHCGEASSPQWAARHVCALGFDGFDLMAGSHAFPRCAIDESRQRLLDVRQAAEDGGGTIASLVLAFFDLSNEAECTRSLQRALEMTDFLGTRTVHLLPRKPGLTQAEGFERLTRVWRNVGPVLLGEGLTVTAENHVSAQSADDDQYLLRTGGDFHRLLEYTEGQILVKFDPAWLCMPGADEEPVPAFERLLPSVGVLDLKDSKNGRFVTPGTGLVNFTALARLIEEKCLSSLSVEVEEHHFQEPTPTDRKVIDGLHRAALAYYKRIFG